MTEDVLRGVRAVYRPLGTTRHSLTEHCRAQENRISDRLASAPITHPRAGSGIDGGAVTPASKR
jgi:hypothetical protein